MTSGDMTEIRRGLETLASVIREDRAGENSKAAGKAIARGLVRVAEAIETLATEVKKQDFGGVQ